MMSELTRLRDEAERLLTTYAEHKVCNDEYIRRKVHVDMDRFLMENRETAMVLVVMGLTKEISELQVEIDWAEQQKLTWRTKLRRLLTRKSKDSHGNPAPLPESTTQHTIDS